MHRSKHLFPILALTAFGGASTAFAQTPGFVTSEQKISSQFGNFGGVLSQRDGFGHAVGSPGDIDGNGTPDAIVGAWMDDDGGTDRGALWVLFLDGAGEVVSEQKISATAGGLVGPLQDNDDFGSSCEGMGDLDGDGVPDIAVGAPGDDQVGSATGAVWILFLNTDGTVKAETRITEGSGGFGGDLDALDLFGQSVLNAGDLDGDGVVDLVTGAQFDDDGGINRGAIWICYLNTDGTVKSEKKISSTTGGFTGVLTATDSFGSSLAVLDDLDGDGLKEIAVGASRSDRDGGFWVGSVWILFLDASEDVVSQVEIGSGLGGFAVTLDDQDRFGYGLSTIQDLDGDGLRELLVGAPKDDAAGSDRGVVYMLFLNNNGTVRDHILIGPGQGGFGPLLDDGDEFGRSVCSLPDLDGDGVEELFVGMPFEDDGGSPNADFGSAWVLFLEDDCATASATFRADNAGQNLLGYLCPPPIIGQSWEPSVDNTGTGNNLAFVVAYSGPLDLFVPGLGSILVDFTDPAGELTGGTLIVGGTGVVEFSLLLPLAPSLCGVPASTQGFSFGAGAGVKLHNAYDVIIGS